MKARSGFRLAAELFGVAVVIAILLGGGVLLSLHWVAHIGSGGPDPIAVVDRDAGYRLDPPGARPVNDVEQGCGSTQLMMSRQFELPRRAGPGVPLLRPPASGAGMERGPGRG